MTDGEQNVDIISDWASVTESSLFLIFYCTRYRSKIKRLSKNILKLIQGDLSSIGYIKLDIKLQAITLDFPVYFLIFRHRKNKKRNLA